MTTATAHALLKAGKDKLAVRALIGAVGTLALLPFSFFVPLPTLTMLPWLAIACVLHTSYQFVLIRAYESNDFAVAYPVARGDRKSVVSGKSVSVRLVLGGRCDIQKKK